MQMSMIYGDIHATQKEPQTLKVTDHISVHTATGDNVCCRCIIR